MEICDTKFILAKPDVKVADGPPVISGSKFANTMEQEADKIFMINRSEKAGWCKKVTPEQFQQNKPKIFSPQHIVPKLGGSARLVHDAREPNMYFTTDDFYTDLAQTPFKYDWEWAGKVDLSDSYMHFEMNDETSWYQCFFAGGEAYRWKKMIWGTNFAPYWMQTITSSICKALKKVFPKAEFLVYLDDFLVIAKEKEDAQEGTFLLKNMLTEAGIKVNEPKSTLKVQQTIDWLGHELSPTSLAVPPQKQQEIRQFMKHVFENNFLHLYQSLVGKLAYYARTIVGARNIVTQLARAIPSEYYASQKSKRPQDFIRINIAEDLKRLIRLAVKLICQPGATFKVNTNKITFDVCTDASIDRLGFSSPDGKYQYTLPLEDSDYAKKLDITLSTPIYLKEQLAVLHALALCPRNINLRILTDNQTVINGVTKARNPNEAAKAISNLIWRLM